MAVAHKSQARTKEHAADRVYDAVKDRLLDGAYAAAEKISVDALADEFGVSRFPVMDAMKRLSVEGFVNIIPQVGSRVSTFTDSEANDLFNLSMEMGGVIAGLAAERRTVEQLLALEELTQEIELLVQRRERATPRRCRHIMRRYLLVMHDMANSRLVTNLAESMIDKLDFMTSTSGLFLPFPVAMERRLPEMENLRHAIVARNRIEAQHAFRLQLAQTRRANEGRGG